MIRQVHPFEILFSIGIFAALVAALFGGGYWLGHRDMDDLRGNARALRNLLEEAHSEGYLVDDADPLRVNVECHGASSDWATIRMANEVGLNYDLPVFIHGNCLTLEVVDLPTSRDNAAHFEGMTFVGKDGPVDPPMWACSINGERVDVNGVSDSDGHYFGCSKKSPPAHGEIVNVPQPEGE
jgi:hypothetical protein